MLVKVQLGEKDYIYLNLAQTIIVRFLKEDFTIHISSIYSTAVYYFENELFYSYAQDLIDGYTLHPLEVDGEDSYNINKYDVKFGED